RPHRERLLLDGVEAGRAPAVRDQLEGTDAVPVAGSSARQGVELLARLLVERPAGEEAVRHLRMTPERRLRELGEALPDRARAPERVGRGGNPAGIVAAGVQRVAGRRVAAVDAA